jgi:hypothetical protein
MMTLNTRLLLELTPFISTILIEVLGSGAQSKLTYQLERLSIGEVLQSADREDVENSAALSFHFEQCMRYYDFAIIATFIVFLTKSLDAVVEIGRIATFGLLTVCLIIALRIRTRQYFETRAPNKYANEDHYTPSIGSFQPIRLYWGEIGIITANMAPIIALVFLEFGI